MRGRLFNARAVARASGFLLVAAAIVAISVRFDQDGAKPQALAPRPAESTDPLAAELARCQSIGMAAQGDAACAAAWSENRRRFFTYRPADSATQAASHPTPKAETEEP
jgi:conjugative transfer region protein TrbK